jgi:pSer/pThr/pTyr-binding forkhead associated (FHA) protein
MARCSTPACPTRGRDLRPDEIEYFAGLGVYVCKLCQAELEGYAPSAGAGVTPASVPAAPPPPQVQAAPARSEALPAPQQATGPEATPWEVTIPGPLVQPTPSAATLPPPGPEKPAPVTAASPPQQPAPAAGTQSAADWTFEDAGTGPAIEDEFHLGGALEFPRIEVYQGQKLRGEYEMRGDIFTIGRLSSHQTGIPDLDFSGYADGSQVSRHHARLVQDGGAYYVEDLGSKSGTWLNGTLLEAKRRYELHDGDEIAVGEVAALVFRLP